MIIKTIAWSQWKYTNIFLCVCVCVCVCARACVHACSVT